VVKFFSMKTWHDDDGFWKAWAPVMFPKERFDKATAEVDQILKLLKIKPGAAVLDLCCGPGRHSIELARRGFNVTGVDRTRAFLAQASKSAAKSRLHVEFALADMRRFRRPQAFDAIINMFTAFGYFKNPADDVRVLKNVCASLRKGGVFMIDLMGKERIAKIFAPRTWHREPDGTIILEERWLEDDFGWIENKWTMIRKGKMRTHTISHRLYSAVELRTLLKQVGFAKVKVFGNLDGGPYNQDAQRLILVAQKD
jgi:SAM-dependent methyltransferase